MQQDRALPTAVHLVQGLLPVYFNPTSSRFTTNKVSVGAMGDSYYEYLLKVSLGELSPAAVTEFPWPVKIMQFCRMKLWDERTLLNPRSC